MGKLHELLAVEDSLAVTFKKVAEEAKDTFVKKDNLFQGRSIRQESKLDQKDIKYVEFPDTTENIPVAETVVGKLQYVAEHASKYFDAVAQKDASNRNATGSVVIEGKTILTDIPAVTLLFLENKLKLIREVIESAKNLDPAKIWASSPTQHVFMAPETSKPVKDSIEEYIITAPATDKHAAQTAKVVRQPIVAVKHSTEFSGLISSHEKSLLLGRVDTLITAIKQARQRANTAETVDVKVAKQLFNFIFDS